MFDKLLAFQQQSEEIKKRLDSISVFGEVESGAIKITANANKKITSIEIDEDFFKQSDREQLEELILTAINKALAKAEEINQTEMQAASHEMLNQMGGLGALGGLFNT